MYQNIIGVLQYCTLTRPDLSFAVNKVCQFLYGAPTFSHWQAVKRILHNVKVTSALGISFVCSYTLSNLTCYTDVDWRIILTIVVVQVVIMCSLVVIWCHGPLRSKKLFSDRVLSQSIVIYAWQMQDLNWFGLSSLLLELQVYPSFVPLLLWDSVSATFSAVNPVLHSKQSILKMINIL